jgi:tRNA modification GTPase
MQSCDTIAAISSAVGPAARIIVRLSGPDSLGIALRLTDTLPEAGQVARIRLSLRNLQFPAWIYVFHSPRSYSGEDLVEFHIPGNTVLAGMLLEELLAKGARSAEPGEFTSRAYFNGRIDLTAAEGVAAAVSACNEHELAAARRLMAGELAHRLAPITDSIAQTLALTEVGIDFSDEDVRFLTTVDALDRIARANAALEALLADSVRFERLAHEPKVLLVGRPNAGKSTLFNALARQQRAVVSPIAGTTRDVLSVELPIRRGVVRLIDVAGLEDTQEQPSDSQPVSIERRRIARLMREHALRTVEAADLVFLVMESGDSRSAPPLPRAPDWIVRSKTDIRAASPATGERETWVSAVDSTGLDELRDVIDRLAFGETSAGTALAVNARHVRAIEDARAALCRALVEVEQGAELLAMELREALDAIAEISGRITPDDVLGRVFAAFCIGK